MAEVASVGASETALILAAERLFAQRGIEAVALRQINQAANQKNMSAAHYHFGSREGLVEAVLEYRLPVLDAHRRTLLARANETSGISVYLRAFILPLAEQLRPRPEGNHYLRFIQQYERYRASYDFARTLSPTGVEIYGGLERLLSYLPAPVRELRMAHLINMIHSVFATIEERLEFGQVAVADIDLITVNAIDMIGGALTAPPSAATIQSLASA